MHPAAPAANPSKINYPAEPAEQLPVKKVKDTQLTEDQACYNALHSATRALAERGNALLKNPFTMLRHVTISPDRIGAMTAAALVILHIEHHRTV